MSLFACFLRARGRTTTLIDRYSQMPVGLVTGPREEQRDQVPGRSSNAGKRCRTQATGSLRGKTYRNAVRRGKGRHAQKVTSRPMWWQCCSHGLPLPTRPASNGMGFVRHARGGRKGSAILRGTLLCTENWRCFHWLDPAKSTYAAQNRQEFLVTVDARYITYWVLSLSLLTSLAYWC